MSGSFSARTDASSFKAPTLRSASVSAAERSVVDRLPSGASAVKGRLRASAARATAYHLDRERCSAVEMSGGCSVPFGEKEGARSVIIPYNVYTGVTGSMITGQNGSKRCLE